MYSLNMTNNTDLVGVQLNQGADVNTASHQNAYNMALSHFPNKYYLMREDISYIEALLENGANASYLSPCIVSTVISQHLHELIQKLIRCGLPPIDISFDEMLLGPDHHAMSPLCLALMTGNVTAARYMWENHFLTNFDLTSLMSNKTVKDFLKINNYQKCLNLLGEIGSQPMSLFRMSFVAASSALGASPGREERVQMLLLPDLFKNSLLFISEDVCLLRSKDGEDINLRYGVTGLAYLKHYFSECNPIWTQ